LFVVVSRQTKKLILCALCVSAVIFLKGFLPVSICVNLRLIAFDPLRSTSVESVFHRASHLFPDLVIQISTEKFKYLWLTLTVNLPRIPITDGCHKLADPFNCTSLVESPYRYDAARSSEWPSRNPPQVQKGVRPVCHQICPPLRSQTQSRFPWLQCERPTPCHSSDPQ